MDEFDQENFVVNLTDTCDTHEKWLSIMRFGLVTLLGQQRLLAELLVREAQRERERSAIPSHVVADHIAKIIAKIIDELGLKFVLAD